MAQRSHSDDDRAEALIRDLAADLEPVTRPAPPVLRALAWLTAVVALAAVLAAFADLAHVWARITASPDMWLAVLGAIATMVLAAIAAFELSRPDAPRAWAVAPLPAAFLWIAASGFGCLRVWVEPQTHAVTTGETGDCLLFIIGLSVPLSALMVMMLRRGYSLTPGLTAAMAGLAAAAAAAVLLNLFHPFDAALTDLAVHVVAVALVVLVSRALGARALDGQFSLMRVTARPGGSNEG